MSSGHQRIKWRRNINIAENFNRQSRVHERYRRQTDRRTDDDIIANMNMSSRSLKSTPTWRTAVQVGQLSQTNRAAAWVSFGKNASVKSVHLTSLYPTAQKTFRNAEPFRRAHQLSPMSK